MSTSSANKSSPTAGSDPLADLLATMKGAADLEAADAYRPPDGDPVDRLSAVIAREAAVQAQAPAGEWPVDEPTEAGVDTPVQAPGRRAPAGRADQTAAGSEWASPEQVSRQVLAALATRSLDGSARAAAVEQLAAQIDSPEPDALREVLAILVTGQIGGRSGG